MGALQTVLAIQAALAAAPQNDVVVTSGPIVAADPWVQSVRGSCRGNVLEISGYGVRRPLGESADIRLNGRSAVGPDIEQLRNDVSLQDAVYRFQIICRTEGFLVVVDRGRSIGGNVFYARGAAYWAGTRFVGYEPMTPTDATSFWF